MGHWTFLWITDLHYELPNANYLDDPKEIEEKYNFPLREKVFVQLENILDASNFEDTDLSFIAIGGDVTTHGKAEGFAKFMGGAFPKLQNLVPADAICIVPGNHDVVWEIDPLANGYFRDKFEDFREMAKTADMTTCLFPSGQLSLSDEAELKFQVPDRGPVFVDKKKKVLVLNFNSAIRCGELNRQMLADIREHVANAKNPTATPASGKKVPPAPPIAIDKEHEESLKKYLVRDVAQITQSQITKLRVRMAQVKKDLAEDWRNCLKVALVHHHVVHYPGQQTEHKGYEFMVDSPLLLQFLESFDFDIVLTGHKHQAYQRVEHFKEKDIFVIGGPTVGGYASEQRGLRLVKFESNQSMRKVEIRDIKTDFANGNVADQIRECVPHKLESITPTKTVVDQGAQQVGYRYRAVASITDISSDGDAHRIVECEDLLVTKEKCPRAQTHPLNLPPTSGYLDQLRAAGKEKKVKPDRELPSDHSARRADDISLIFSPKLQVGQPVSYYYEWLAVNAFAMDKLQFDRKYGDPEELQHVEYTHFVVRDPIEDLTVLVQFPRGFKLQTPPQLRLAKVDPHQPDSRKWAVDDDMVNLLERSHALRYYESLNAAAIRVKAPSAGFAYGIQWDLPDAPAREGAAQLDKIAKFFSTPDKSDKYKKSMGGALKAAREVLVPGWEGELDGSLMIFEVAEKDGKIKPGQLRSVYAMRSPSVAQYLEEWESLPPSTRLGYGLGIAGRAFKANRIRVYDAPKEKSDLTTSTRNDRKLAPDFYERTQGRVLHKALVSFPLHIPVEAVNFQKKSDVYENREPYGVVNIGSASPDCPVLSLLEEKRSQLLSFQHLVNQLLYDVAFPAAAGMTEKR